MLIMGFLLITLQKLIKSLVQFHFLLSINVLENLLNFQLYNFFSPNCQIHLSRISLLQIQKLKLYFLTFQQVLQQLLLFLQLQLDHQLLKHYRFHLKSLYELQWWLFRIQVQNQSNEHLRVIYFFSIVFI